MLTVRTLRSHPVAARCLSSLLHTNPSKDVALFREIPQNCFSSNVIYPRTSSTDLFLPSYAFNSPFGSCRWMSTPRKRSMRSKVEARMRKESSKTLREIRRAKKLKLKLMTEEERLIYSLRRAKKKVALLLQKLKKYELPELPLPKHDPELLTAEQLQAYKKIGFRNRNYVPVGVRGVFGGVVQNMHMHWKFHETVQVCCDNFPKEKIKEMATMLARLSGGIVINIHNVKTIIMFRGRNYRQPKNLIPVNTLTKRKALFKARFEQALESQKLNIKKIEQQLRRKGINPDDPVAMASIQRVASTFFNAIDKKEGSPYVLHGVVESESEPQKSLEPSEPVDDSDQEELDKFIAEIEDAADKEWAAEEAADNKEFGRIRYWNREDSGGRSRKPEPYRYDDANAEIIGEHRGWKNTNTRQRAADSEDEDDSEGINGWEADDGDATESEREAPEDSVRFPLRAGKGRPVRSGRPYYDENFKRESSSKLTRNMTSDESELDETISDLENVVQDSDLDEDNNMGAPTSACYDYHKSRDGEEDHILFKGHGSNRLSGIDDSETDDDDDSDEGHSRSELFRDRSKKQDNTAGAHRNGFNGNSKAGYDRKMASNESDLDEILSDTETAMWESDDIEDFDSRALRAADDDYRGTGGETGYHVQEDENNVIHRRDTRTGKLKDEHWDSD